MSDYWDAVARAALDLPAAATPRPRSLFEPDAAAPGAEPPELPVERIDAAGPARAHRATPAAAPLDDDPIEPRDPAGDPNTQAARADPAPDHARPESRVAQQREAEATPSTGAAAPYPPPVTPPPGPQEVHHVDRVEMQRIERTHTVLEPAPVPVFETPTEPARGLQDQPVAASPSEAPPPFEPPTLREAAPPIVAVAEPVPLPPQPLEPAAPGQEPAPLLIEIHRVDIRIEPETVAPPAAAAVPRRTEVSVPSLSDYLARRDEARE